MNLNLCKSRGGGISARTKSLREKFSSKRSYSELTFKDSTTSLTETTDLSSPGTSFKSRNPPKTLNLSSVDSIRVSLSKNETNTYNLLPEEAYCSALDINCSDSEPRFPWQRDVAIQCNYGDPVAKKHANLSRSSEVTTSSSTVKKRPPHSLTPTGPLGGGLFGLGITSGSSAAAGSAGIGGGSAGGSISPSSGSSNLDQVQKKHSGLSTLTSNLRFWKSSSPLSSTGEIEKKPSTRKRLTRSALHRAASFDSKGYSRLIQQASIDSPTTAHPNVLSHDHLAVPNATPGLSLSSSPSSDENVSNSILHESNFHSTRLEGVLEPEDGAENDEDEDEEETEEENDSDDDRNKEIYKHAEIRFTFSGPGAYQTGSTSAPQSRSSSPPRDLIDEKRELHVTGKDVYMSLPSPNVHTEGQECNPVFKKFAGLTSHGDESEPEEPLQEEPPASALHRRRALVPPKLITDGYESATDETEHTRESSSSPLSSNLLAEPTSSKARRRSSIVVIPPMQICPGDLLVYSKVLTHRNDLLDNFDGSTQCLAVTEDASRKGKNTWSLLKLFDRSNRTKSDSLCGLEEVLSTLTPSVFVDEQLSKYKGMSWADFETQFEERRASSIISGHRLSQLQSDSRRSSAQSSLTGQSNTNISISLHHSPTKSPRRPGLLRTQTFDSAQTNSTDDSLLEVNAHSIRSNSCIAPVSTSIRRLSGGLNFREESLDEGQCEDVPSPGSTATIGQNKSQAQNQGQDQDAVETDTNRSCVGPGSVGGGGGLMASLHANSSIQSEPASPPNSSSSPTSSRSSFALTRSEFKRREALWDLFQSECVFLYAHLMVLKNVFMEPLKKIQVEGFAMFAEPEVLFGNLDELCCVTYAFCKEFLSLMLQQMNSGDLNPAEVLVKLFQKSSKATALTQAYHRYTLNYINALNYLETLRRQVEFNEFEKWCARDPRCKKLQLTDLLVSPVQHIMRVPLILKDIEMRTEDATERELISQIIESEEASLRELDDKMKWLKNFERLLEIQRNIVWPSVLDLDPKVFIPECLKAPLSKQPCERLIVSPRRQIIIEGPLNILDSGKPVEMYVVLFDDMLIITRRKKGLHKKQSSLTEKWASTCSRASSGPHESPFKYVVYKQPLSLDRFYIHDVTAAEGAAHNLKYVFVLVCLNRFQQIVTIHTFQAPNESTKINWLSKLKDTADRWKRTLQNTVFRSQQRLSSASVSTTSSCRDTAVNSR
ncbi:uncharacterized protein LOC107367281 [Tetranychus urticae]|nr:uncharacterized protein LOC107367281 [Tetranychus urticae]